jgi:hypothetical protein
MAQDSGMRREMLLFFIGMVKKIIWLLEFRPILILMILSAGQIPRSE